LADAFYQLAEQMRGIPLRHQVVEFIDDQEVRLRQRRPLLARVPLAVARRGLSHYQ